jgi:S1-C subfamily serine protease
MPRIALTPQACNDRVRQGGPYGAIVVIIGAFLTGCTTPDPGLKNPGIATVQIDGKTGSAGRGFFVSADGNIVTRLHLIGHAHEINIARADGQKLTAEFVQGNDESDLAVIKTFGSNFPFLRIDTSEIVPGLHVRIIASNGITNGLFDEWEDSGNAMGISARLTPGDSGSPVIGDDGRVIAIIAAPIAGHPEHYSATPIGALTPKMLPGLVPKFPVPGE